jgi:cell division protein FtsI/penicillin-binding protein 2
MNTIIISATLSTTVMTIYYLTIFREETKNENYSEFFVSIVLFLLLYIAMFILIFNIINVYNINKSFSKSTNMSSLDNVTRRRAREDTFARLLARNAPDPDNVINPLFDRSPQFLSGPFGPNNPRGNQIAYTFYNVT